MTSFDLGARSGHNQDVDGFGNGENGQGVDSGGNDIGVDGDDASDSILTRRRAGTAGRRKQEPPRVQEPARGRRPRAAELKIVYEFAKVEGNFNRPEYLQVCEILS